MNPLDLVNIPPDYPPETTSKVSTTERNRIHHLTRYINNIIMGITSTGRITAETISKTNSPMLIHIQGFQL